MEYKIEIPKNEDGFRFKWEDNFKVEVKIDNNTVIINANKEGLISLARHLINGHYVKSIYIA